jgi:hypothetical protein
VSIIVSGRDLNREIGSFWVWTQRVVDALIEVHRTHKWLSGDLPAPGAPARGPPCKLQRGSSSRVASGGSRQNTPKSPDLPISLFKPTTSDARVAPPTLSVPVLVTNHEAYSCSCTYPHSCSFSSSRTDRVPRHRTSLLGGCWWRNEPIVKYTHGPSGRYA